MVLITPDTGHLSTEEILSSAEELFTLAETLLWDQVKQLQAGGGPANSDMKKDLRIYMDAVGFFISERQKVEQRRAKIEGVAKGGSGYALDLGEARSEIGRRLACLRNASGTGDVSGRT